MQMSKEHLEAGLKACNHFAGAYPNENTPELQAFILVLELSLDKTKKCAICADKGFVTMKHNEDGVDTVMGYAKCLRCEHKFHYTE